MEQSRLPSAPDVWVGPAKTSIWLLHLRTLKISFYWLPFFCWKINCYFYCFPPGYCKIFFSLLFFTFNCDVLRHGFLYFSWGFLKSVAWCLSGFLVSCCSFLFSATVFSCIASAPLPLSSSCRTAIIQGLMFSLYVLSLIFLWVFSTFCYYAVALGFGMDIFLWFIFHLLSLFSLDSNLLINSSIEFLISAIVFFYF